MVRWTRTPIRYLAFAAVLFLIGACSSAMVVDSTTPRPVPDVAVPAHGYELTLSDRIPDEFDLRSHGQVKAAKVSGWHTTLLRGFQATFGTIDTSESDGQAWRLRITHSRLTFESRKRRAAVTLLASNGGGTLIAHGSRSSPKTPRVGGVVVARISFACELLSPEGERVGSAEATVYSEKSVREAGTPSEATKEAVEAMYEEMVRQLFRPHEATG